MQRAAALAWSHSNVLTEKRYRKLIEQHGSLDDAFLHIDEELLRAIGCRDDGVRDALTRLASFDLDACEAFLAERGVTFLSMQDENYPQSLKDSSDAPVFLYLRGDFAALGQPGIGIVGTRGSTAYGRRCATDISETVVRAGFTTISGLAEGIDGDVASATLKAGGRTVAVLGHGLATIFPQKHERLADQIVQHGGLLITEYAPDVPGLQYNFPARNRIIAALSRAVVVVEAPVKSGALITAQFALEEGRDVYAVPGPLYAPTSEGCNALINSGSARLLLSPEELLKDLGVRASDAPRSTYEPASDDERAVYAALTPLPQTVDTLVEKAGLSAAVVRTQLTMLELAGAAQNLGGGQWARR